MTDFSQHPDVLLLSDLLSIPAPSGREERMATEIMRLIEEFGHPPQRDAQGNVWVEIAGKNPSQGKVALASHMDELSMVITAIQPDGTLKVRPSGGLHPYKLGECPVEIVGDGSDTVPAHLCFGSTHTTDPQDPNTDFAAGKRGITWPHAWLLTGLTPTQLSEAGVRVGATAVPVTGVRGPYLLGPIEDPLLSAWLLDNRGGTLSLLRLLKRITEQNVRFNRSVCLCFMVQEESGLLGARGWAMCNPVEIFVAVDSSPAPKNMPLKLDGTPAIWSKDSSLHFDQGLIRDFAQAAKQAHTELQYAVYDRAASDASGVLQAGAAPRAATIGYPRENSHGYEVCRLSVFEALSNTMFEFLNTLT